MDALGGGKAGGLEGGHRVEVSEFFEGRKGGFADRVSLNVIGQSPTIEHNEYHWSIHFFVFQEFLSYLILAPFFF